MVAAYEPEEFKNHRDSHLSRQPHKMNIMNVLTNSRITKLLILILLTGLASCGGKNNESKSPTEVASLELNDRLVLPGDFADPSIIRVGEEYWATATSSQWAPLYPILRSENMTDWEIVTHVFPDSLPT